MKMEFRQLKSRRNPFRLAALLAGLSAVAGCGADSLNLRDLPYLGIHDNRPGAESPDSSAFRKGSADSDPAISFEIAENDDEIYQFFIIRDDEKRHRNGHPFTEKPEEVVGNVYSYVFGERRTNQAWDKSISLMDPAMNGDEYPLAQISCGTTEVLEASQCEIPAFASDPDYSNYFMPYDPANRKPLPASGTMTYDMGVNVHGEPQEGRPIAFGITDTSTLDGQATISEVWETDSGELVVRLDDGATGRLTLNKPATDNSPEERIVFPNLSFDTETLPDDVGISHTIHGTAPNGHRAQGGVEGRYLNGVWYGRFYREGHMSRNSSGDITSETRAHLGVFAIGNGIPE